MNVDLLLKIKAAILADPDSFRMDTWTCGTAHCIAGWACVLSDQPITGGAAATRVLAIDRYQGDGLFHVGCWPAPIAARYAATDDRRERAAIAAERIDSFIATAGSDGVFAGDDDEDDGWDWGYDDDY